MRKKMNEMNKLKKKFLKKMNKKSSLKFFKNVFKICGINFVEKRKKRKKKIPQG